MPRARPKKWQRRPRGSGSIHPRRDGLWAAVPPKALNVKARYFRTRADAEAWLHLQLSRYDAQPTTPLGDYLTDWFSRAAPLLGSPASVSTYQGSIDRLAPLWPIPIGELRPSHVEVWAGELLKTHAHNTVNMARRTLSTALEAAVRDELLPRNVARLARLPKAPPVESKAYTIDEVSRLLAVAAGHHLESLLCLALLHGLRIGELRGLQWQDVDWQTGVLRVERQIGEHSAVVRPTTKGRRARLIKLASRTLAALQAQQAAVASRSVWLHPSPQGAANPISNSEVRRQWFLLLDQAGLPRRNFHSSRHTAASILHELGIPDAQRAVILGHSSIRTTAGYTHAIGDQADAVRALDRALGT